MRGAVCVAAALLWAGAGLAQSAGPGGQSAEPAAAVSGPKRPMTFEDMMKMRRLGDIDVSRDGKWVLFTVTDVDLAKNTKTPHLWIVPVAGGAEAPLTASAAGESRGRFSPDGKQIAFLMARREGGDDRRAASADAHLDRSGQRDVVAGWEAFAFYVGGVSGM